MLILLGLLAVIVVCGLLTSWLDYYNFWSVLSGTLAVLASGLLLIFLIVLPLSRLSCADQRVQIEAIRATIQQARVEGSSRAIESAALQLEIVKCNSWIASAKYWNGTAFDIWWPDWVDELEPIR